MGQRLWLWLNTPAQKTAQRTRISGTQKAVFVIVVLYAIYLGFNTHGAHCFGKDVVKVDYFPGQSMLWVEGSPKFVANDNLTQLGWGLMCTPSSGDSGAMPSPTTMPATAAVEPISLPTPSASPSASTPAATKPCYKLAKDGWHAHIECPTADLAESALFDVLTAYHSKLNHWGGAPEIKREDRLMSADGQSMKVKYRVIQRDKFGEEQGEGSDWLMSQTFEHEGGVWTSGVNLMETMHY